MMFSLMVFVGFVSVPLRGKGIKEHKQHVLNPETMAGFHVSVPLRGKGIKEQKEIFHLLKGVENPFPSPCGEKVLRNWRYYERKNEKGYFDVSVPLRGKGIKELMMVRME